MVSYNSVEKVNRGSERRGGRGLALTKRIFPPNRRTPGGHTPVNGVLISPPPPLPPWRGSFVMQMAGQRGAMKWWLSLYSDVFMGGSMGSSLFFFSWTGHPYSGMKFLFWHIIDLCFYIFFIQSAAWVIMTEYKLMFMVSAVYPLSFLFHLAWHT